MSVFVRPFKVLDEEKAMRPRPISLALKPVGSRCPADAGEHEANGDNDLLTRYRTCFRESLTAHDAGLERALELEVHVLVHKERLRDEADHGENDSRKEPLSSKKDRRRGCRGHARSRGPG